MSKFSIKPVWIGGIALLVAVGAAIRVAVAIDFFNPADQPIGYVAQDEMTNFDLRSNAETLFRGQYEREGWSGDLFAYPVSNQGDVDLAGRRWSAADQIDLQNFNTGRFIATMKDDGTAVPFRLGSLSAAQASSLNNSEALVNYLRGERIAEGTTFRNRFHVLGGIVHSRPFYVADAAPTVFVGANDGMLHAINALPTGSGGGDERWAYVPSMLIPKLKNLASTVLPFVPDYYVDGQINIAGITTGGIKRILVGGLGAGGKGLYALNITGTAGLTAASDASVASKVMWEISPTKLNYANPTTTNAYVNLGYTYGTVTIAKVAGVDAVIVGNGYNDGLPAGGYAGCSNATPNYANCGGNYAAYLYVINAATGQLIRAIKAGADGTAASPNGLSTPAAVDSDGNGSVDRVYAGDLNGTMWKFDLTAGTATALLTTSPAQAITMTPAVAIHPDGGYMVNFATGKMLVAADTTDTSVHYAYGVWDGAPLLNAALLTQTLTERSFTDAGGVTSRVRNVTSNSPVWTSGALNHKGWKVALPAGERVVGEGSFVENERFYFTSHDPTKTSAAVTGTSTTIKGENWLMELDYLSGGTKNQPFLDLSGDVILNNGDRIKYTATDTLPTTTPATVVGGPILTTDGISVGKYISTGVLSQPILVQNLSLNDTLFNQNPDVTIPRVILGQGVDGGHFDQDIYYRSGAGAVGTQATASITVGTTGQTNPFPATLGEIKVNGVTIMPALTVADLPNGFSATANAAKIASKISGGGGFTATSAGAVVTVRAPAGADYNGMVLTVADGSSQTLVPAIGSAAVAPSPGRVVITDARRDKDVSIQCGSTVTSTQFTTADSSTLTTRLNDVFTKISGKTVNGYTTTCVKTGSTTALTCTIAAPAGVSACPGGFTVDSDFTVTTNTGPAGGSSASTTTPQSGFTNFKPALLTTAFSGGADATVAGDNCRTTFIFFTINLCAAKNHIHQYDDIYDVTGVDMLNASSAAQNLANAIPSTSTKFKVLAHNQYLSPAVKLHIGNPGYLNTADVGYVRIKDFMTSATLDVTDPLQAPTYSRSTTATPTSIPIGSLALNMPTDALTARDWWGNGDVRVGLHPTVYSCAYSTSAISGTDGNMYQPVIPPANGINGPGTAGWSASSMPGAWPTSTATGARHNGALTIQLIAANTPNSAIEQNLPGRPEYGWRVKSADFSTYVLAEYNLYWHHPNGKCYSQAGWTKTPGLDTGTSGAVAKAAGSTDPKLGVLGVGAGTVVSTVITASAGGVTTTLITYSSGLTATIVRTPNLDASGRPTGSITIVTTDTTGARTTQVIASSEGTVKSGGDERGLQAKTGRISWRELVAP